MQSKSKIVLAIVAGAALGGVVVQGLHAQAKPSVYFVAEIYVNNPDAYGKEYAPKMQALIKSHGGRQVAIGGTAGGRCKDTHRV